MDKNKNNPSKRTQSRRSDFRMYKYTQKISVSQSVQWFVSIVNARLRVTSGMMENAVK